MTDADGGVPRALTKESSSDIVPFWPRDGRWIYFSSDRTGTNQIWKLPVGGGPPIQVTQHGGINAKESPDGRFLYFATSYRQAAIKRVPIAGGAETEVVSGPILSPGWTVSRSGLWYITLEHLQRGTVSSIWFFDFDSSMESEILRTRGPFLLQRVTVSPDERELLYTVVHELRSELMLVENFR